MSRICANCGKGAQVGNSIPNSKQHTKRRFQVNLQRFKIKVDRIRRVLLCPSCWKKMSKIGQKVVSSTE